MLGERLGADRTYYAFVEGDYEVAIIERDYIRENAPSVVGTHAFASFGSTFAAYREGRTMVFEDVEAPGAVPTSDLPSFRALSIRALVSTPLFKQGRTVASMTVLKEAPHRWTAQEVALVQEVAERTWAAVERARAEAAMRETEARLAAAFESVPVGVAVIDTAGSSLLANAHYRRFLPNGLIPSRDPARAARWRAWDEAGRPLEPQDFPGARALRGETVVPGQEMLYTDDDGHEVWTNVATAPTRDDKGIVTGAVAAIADTTEAKRAGDALRDSEERFRHFGEASQDVLWIRDVETMQWTYLTPAFETVYGVTREQALAGDNYRSWLELIVPKDRDHAAACIERVRQGEWVTFEYRIRRPLDGKIRWLRNTDFPMKDSAGRVAQFGGIGQDITKLKSIERALATAERRQRVLLEGMPQLVWRAVDSGEWTWASPQWVAHTGQSDAASHGWGWIEMVHPDDRPAAREAWAQAMEAGGFEVEYRIRAASDHAYRWFQTRASPVREEQGAIVEWLGTSTDIEDLRHLQGRQTVLVAELQHRVRNILSVVRSVFQRTTEMTDDPEQMADHFRGRLDAMARTQVMATRSASRSIDLEDLIRDELLSAGVVDGPNFDISGPDLALPFETAEPIALAIHELTTNALKYGALQAKRGRLDVHWDINLGYGGARQLNLIWEESGVPAVPISPSRKGFGRELIEEALPYRLGAKTKLEFVGNGVRCSISVELPSESLVP